jgi:hypothetical protein
MRAVVLLKSVVPRGRASPVSALMAAVLLATPLWADAEGTETSIAPDAVSAVWTLQELRFKLEDSPAQYTCKEFRDTVKVLLVALGARKDLQVEPAQCTNTRVDFGKTPGILGVPMGAKDGSSDAPQVSIRMQVLKLLAEPQPILDGLPAHWKSIDLVGKHGPLYTSDCTLTKQVAEVILPLFSSRNVEYNSSHCDHIIGKPVVHLHLEVLVTDQR